MITELNKRPGPLIGLEEPLKKGTWNMNDEDGNIT
jgi:hypothetical protein